MSVSGRRSGARASPDPECLAGCPDRRAYDRIVSVAETPPEAGAGVAPPGGTFEDVFVNSELLIFRGCRIYRQSFVAPMYAAHYRRPSRYGLFLLRNYVLRRGATRVPSAVWVLDNFSPGSYFHWLIECLPRILHAETLHPEERVLLLPSHFRRSPYVEFTLKAFPQVRRVGWIDARAKIRVERLAFVPRPPVHLGRAPRYLPEQIAEVARRVGALAGAPGGTRNIYFTRADAARRRARNEKDLVRVLRSYEFDVIEIDPAKPWEQVQASRGAHLMVGVHGAALSNLIFMPPGGRLIELRRPEREGVFFFNTYRPLAEAVGIDYLAQLCEPANDAPGYEINDVDLTVDLDLLRENLRHATGTPAR